MKRTVEQLEHTEEYKHAVESCKEKRLRKGLNPDNCFPIITKQFQDAKKPIYKKDQKRTKQTIKQGLTERSVRIYSEFQQ